MEAHDGVMARLAGRLFGGPARVATSPYELAEAQVGLPVGHAREHVPPTRNRTGPPAFGNAKERGTICFMSRVARRVPARLAAPAG